MLQGLVGTILMIVQVAVVVTSVYAFVHAAMQRPDAYPAAGKLTKPAWLGILGAGIVAATLLAFLLGVLGLAAAACASGIYLVDVRPKLLEVQGKSR